MRRKVLQEFTNVFCQRLIDLPNGCDLAVFVERGSGKYTASILTGECTFAGQTIAPLRTCQDYKRWLFRQLEKHQIATDAIQAATLEIDVTVGKVKKCATGGHALSESSFAFACDSEIQTDERSYKGSSKGQKTWRFEAGNPRPMVPPNDDVTEVKTSPPHANGNGAHSKEIAHKKEEGEQDHLPSGFLSRFWQKLSSPPRSSVVCPADRGEPPSG